MTKHRYSDFFATLHDERHPVGYLGRGTHYSILRAVVFHDPLGRPLPIGHFADFAIIWDEDHDERVIEPIEEIYNEGFLGSFLFFGERKGALSCIVTDECDENRRSVIAEKVSEFTQSLDDPWPAEVVSSNAPTGIIHDHKDRVALYLRNLRMLWNLGLKKALVTRNPSHLDGTAI